MAHIFLLAPQPLESRRIARRVFDRVFNFPMPEVILNEPGIGALIGKREAAGVAQHMGTGDEGQGSGGAARLQK